VRARAYGSGGLAGPWNQTPINVTGAPPVLGAVTNLTATGLVMGMLLTWQLPDRMHLIGGDATEIWFNTTNNRGTAKLLGSFALPTNSYTMTNLLAGQTLYFWARVRGTDSGNYSPEVGPAIGQTSSDAQQILSYLTGQITSSQLGQDLLKTLQPIEPEMAGDSTSYAGDATSWAGTWTLLYAQKSGDMVISKRVDTVAAQMTGFGALVQTETQARIDGDTALASQVTNVQATAGSAQALAQQAITTSSSVSGSVSAAITWKVQVDPGTGLKYAAGIAVGIDNSSGIVQSQCLIQADRFALLNVSNGNVSTPFVVQGGQTFINQAFIGSGWITNAMIGGVIQSTALDSTGNPLWSLDKNGGLQIRGSNGSGRTVIDGNGGLAYDSNGVLRVQWGTW
jgi:predicted phage tail protein